MLETGEIHRFPTVGQFASLNSSSKCNVRIHQRDELLVEELVGRSIATGFPRTVIQVVHGLVHLLPRDLSEVRVFRKKLSK